MRRFLPIVAVVVVVIGLIAAPAAADKPDEKNRPVEDWYRDKRDPIENGLQSNGQNAYLPNHWNEDGPGYWSAGGFAPYGCGMTDDIVQAVDKKTKFQGKITERALPDGRAEVHVDIHVRNSPLTVFRNEEMFAWLDACFGPADPIPLPDPIAGEGSDGSYDYDMEIVVVIPQAGGVIPNWLSIANGFIPSPPYDVTYLRIDAKGTATFTDAAASGPEGFIPGTRADVELFVEFSPVIFIVDLDVSAAS